MGSLRWIPLCAIYLSLIALAMALQALLVGVTGHNPNAAEIITFNTSSLGLSAYNDPTSPLFSEITALVPSNITQDPPSITQYLGVKDWYRMHYYRTCSGFFAPHSDNPSHLTARKINITCVSQRSGYSFSLHKILASELQPSVLALLDDVDTKSHSTGVWINFWYTGLSNCSCAILYLLFILSGTRKCFHFFIVWVSAISSICFIVSSAVLTNAVLGIHHMRGPLGPNSYPGGFLGIIWLGTTAMTVVFCLAWVEWRFERWTPVGERITTYTKPKDARWFWFSRYREEGEFQRTPWTECEEQVRQY